MSKTIIQASSRSGHRASYCELFEAMSGGSSSIGRIDWGRFTELISAEKVILATIDDEYFRGALVVFVRSFLLRPTYVLFLRPWACFLKAPLFKSFALRLIFILLRRLPRSKVLSIVPHTLNPQLKRVTNDWIYDPQMWDLWVNGTPCLPDSGLSDRVIREKIDRKVLVFIGKGNDSKQFSLLADLATECYRKLLIVVAGKVDVKFRDHADRMREVGMIVESRYVTDEEVLSLYKVADYSWCCYSPKYDQASGVFGRSIQTGVMPIVRRGSVISQFGFSYLDVDDLLKNLEKIESKDVCYDESVLNYQLSTITSRMILDVCNKLDLGNYR